MQAPIFYLRDIHDIEMGLFEFGKDTLAMHEYPDVVPYYARYFSASPFSTQPNPLFLRLAQTLNTLFHQYRLFHILTALVVMLGFVVVFSNSGAPARYFCFYAVGTYLLFSYINPHAPFRFLMQIVTPGTLGVLMALGTHFDRGRSPS